MSIVQPGKTEIRHVVQVQTGTSTMYKFEYRTASRSIIGGNMSQRDLDIWLSCLELQPSQGLKTESELNWTELIYLVKRTQDVQGKKKCH